MPKKTFSFFFFKAILEKKKKKRRQPTRKQKKKGQKRWNTNTAVEPKGQETQLKKGFREGQLKEQGFQKKKTKQQVLCFFF